MNQIGGPTPTFGQRWPFPAWLIAALIVAITAIVYLPAMQAGFVWDDDTHLVKHIVLQENGLYRAWFTRDAFVYYPVTWTSYWIEHAMWGLDPTGYHVSNILIHLICSLLIWRILRRLRIPGAWVVALIFAIHPMNVETAAWITQRKNLLAMLFYLTSSLLYLRHEDRTSRAGYLLAVVCFLLGMLSKGAIVALPAVLLLLAWWRRGRITRHDVIRSLPFFAIGFGMSFVEIFFQYSGENVGASDVRTDPWLARIAGVGWVIWFYIYKTILPIKLAFVYPRWDIDPTSVTAWLPLAALIAVFVVFFIHRKTWGRPLLFALLYFCFTIFPASGLVNFYYLKYSFVADHYAYVSIVAVIALVVVAVMTLAVKARLGPVIPAVAAAFVILILGGLTWRQASAYENVETIFRDSVSKYPEGWMAHHNLANHLHETGRSDEATRHYLETIRLNPEHDKAASNLAQAYLSLGRADDAARTLQDAVERQPDNELFRYDFAELLGDLGRAGDAKQQWREAIRINPDNPLSRDQYARLLAAHGDSQEAIQQWREAIRIDDHYAYAHASLGYALFQQGQYALAVPHLQRVIELEPDFAAQANLPALLAEARRRAR